MVCNEFSGKAELPRWANAILSTNAYKTLVSKVAVVIEAYQ